MAIKNIAASVLNRLKNQSKEEGIPFQMVLQLFVQEEFLRKLALSEYVDNLILKGGMFIYTLTEFDSRPTRDIDFLIKNLCGSLENIEQTMRDICNISTGNDFVSPEVFTYSLESTIAEKFDAILQRMAGTSRMKDFYDIYYLSGIFDFEGEILIEAVKNTLIHRNRELSDVVFAEIADFKNNNALNTQWKAFGPAKGSGLLFDDVVNRIAVFLEPIYQNILRKTDFDKRCSCESKMWM